MTTAKVFRNNVHVGMLVKNDDTTYSFTYTPAYLKSPSSKNISVTFPLRSEPFHSEYLFSFFFNMLAEGNIKKAQCRNMKIDENDSFTRLLKTASDDVIGAITVEEIFSEVS